MKKTIRRSALRIRQSLRTSLSVAYESGDIEFICEMADFLSAEALRWRVHTLPRLDVHQLEKQASEVKPILK